MARKTPRVLIDDGAISTAYETNDDPSNARCFLNLGPRQHCSNGFLQAAVTAFSEHYPFIMRPQHIWILILQVVAEHVNRNAQELRSKWIATPVPEQPSGFSGSRHSAPGGSKPEAPKIALIVDKNDFVLGSPTNDWASVVLSADEGNENNFLKQIQRHVVPGTMEDVLIGDMLTGTTTIEHVTMGITVMDALQSYFDSIMRTLCGFPSITLEGSLADWQLIRSKAESLIRTRCRSMVTGIVTIVR